jgi:hypothetical protein
LHHHPHPHPHLDLLQSLAQHHNPVE